MNESLLSLIDAATKYLNASIPTNDLCQKLLDSSGFWTVVGILISLGTSALASWWNGRKNEKKKKVEKCSRRLEEFYNPLYFRIQKNTKLYEIFKVDDKYHEERTLNILLERKSLLPEDESLLKEIIANNDEILQLVNKNAGYIDRNMMDCFVELARHYVLLKKAYEGILPDRTEYRNHPYPAAINNIVEEKVYDLISVVEGRPKRKSPKGKPKEKKCETK